MELKHVVVDGSNIATEGRSLPSLRQLDEAVRAFLAENPTENLTVIVDATFGHRIEADERDEYEAAILAGELITPPAGAIGRGDAFVLQVAERVDAAILSNDSFQEFHPQYSWLFDEGRLIGGKPVPGVGWVFLLRTPVRGPTSRRAMSEAKRKARKDKPTATPAARPSTPARKRTAKASAAPAKRASAGGADASGGDAGRQRRRREGRKPDEPINEPLPFIEFVANHPVGSELDGVVERFSSHGAYVEASGATCYVPLRLMGDPPPRAAREALTVGETRRFTVDAIDGPRRGIDLALVVDASDIDKANTRRAITATKSPTENIAQEAPVTPAKKATKKAAAKKAPAKKKAAAKKAPAKKKAAAKKAPAKKAPAKKKAAAKKAPAKKKAAAKKAPAKKKAAAKKAPAKKKAAAKKAPAKKKAAAKKAPAKKKAAAKKAPAKKKAAAKKAPARKR